MKVSIFIASSKEGKEYAYLAKKQFTSIGDVTVWDDNFFHLNESTFDNLCKRAIQYDFSVIVYTKDDMSFVRKQFCFTPRDNITFEHGLFTGIIGRHKTYALIQKGVKIPSDLCGINYSYFSDKNDLLKSCQEILVAMKRECQVSRISMLPSTAIALSYFHNFLKPICEALYTDKKIQYKGQFLDFKAPLNHIHIVLPENLEETLVPFVQCVKYELSLEPVLIQGPYRKFTTFLTHTTLNDYKIIDIPTGLNVAYQAVKLYFAVDYIGDSEEIKGCLQKEIENFASTLKLLLNSNVITKRLVDIIYYKN